MLRFIFILQIFFFCNFLYAQEFSTLLLNNDLTENANAVIRLDESEFRIFSENEAKYKKKIVITILNRNGDIFGIYPVFYNRFSKITSISGKLLDSNGKLIRKIKKEEIFDYSAASNYSLYEDQRVKVLRPVFNTYPITLVFEYELKYNGSLFFPVWHPVIDYKISVEKSIFSIITPEKDMFRYKMANHNSEPVINTITEAKKTFYKYEWQLTNHKSLSQEPYSNSLSEYTPIVYTAPNKFKMENYAGDLSSWENFGKWISLLNSSRDKINDDTKKQNYRINIQATRQQKQSQSYL